MEKGIIRSTFCRAYRFFRHHGGYGIHSPFAYGFITKVVDERRGYYAYDDIELVRKQLAQKGRLPRGGAFTAKENKLLFRLANFTGARRIIELGAGDGLTALYLTYPSSEARCLVVEADENRGQAVRQTYDRWGRGAIRLLGGDPDRRLDEALAEMGRVDLLVVGPAIPPEAARAALEKALPHCHERTLLAVGGLRRDETSLELWRWLTARIETTVTFDLCVVGVAILNPKLHEKNYKVYF